MRLLKIDIENFGKLNNFHMNLEQNLSVIIHENGWGKSTLAAFIRVMFYGFMDENKKKPDERERNVYRPWNHGVYGGAVDFEVNGRRYRLERTFGAKVSEDKSRLVDIITKITCNDFDLDRIGEQLFGINSEAYIRTLFVAQNNLEIRNEKDGIEDGITAKIGNLTEATDDINNYDSVIERLMKLSYSIKSGSKKGEINHLLVRKDEIVRKLNTSEAIEQNIEMLSADIEKIATDLEKDQLAMKQLDEEYERAGRLEAVNAKLDSYRQLIHEIDVCKEKIKTQNQLFELRIPEMSEVDEMIIYIKEAMSLKERIDGLSRMVGKKNYDSDDMKIMPEEQEIEHIISVINKREDCITKLKETEIKYEHEKEMFLMRKDMQNMENRHRQEELEKELKEQIRSNKAKNRTTIIVGSIIVAIIIVLSSGMFFFTKNLLVLGGFVFAVIVMGLTFLIVKNNDKKRFMMNPVVTPKMEYEFENEELKLAKIKELMGVHNEKIDSYSKTIIAFCEKYGLSNNEALENELHIILGKLSQEARDSETVNEYNLASERLAELTSMIQAWFGTISRGMVYDWLDNALMYKQTLNSIYYIQEQIDEKTEKVKQLGDFEDEYKALKETRNISEIIRLRNELDDKINNSKGVIDLKARQLEELKEMQSEIENAKENLLIIDKKLEEYQHKYDIITKTMGYLNKAKEQLSARYMDPIGDAFSKYYSFITTDYIDAYEVDADMRLTRQELGMGRSRNSLSKGYRDLVDISLRMALIEVMYEEEKPWIIFDDPFVNLDSDKLSQVRTFLEEISKHYQVIYFSCHESRA